MRIALTSVSNSGIDDQIFDHFGHAPYFTIVDVQNHLVKKTTIVTNPYLEQHLPGDVPSYLAELGVNIVITGSMGDRAREILSEYKIEVFTGTSGLISSVMEAYLNGVLVNNP